MLVSQLIHLFISHVFMYVYLFMFMLDALLLTLCNPSYYNTHHLPSFFILSFPISLSFRIIYLGKDLEYSNGGNGNLEHIFNL